MSDEWIPEPVEVVSPLDWMVDAACAETDPEAFFPERGGSTRDAKRVCAVCDVQSQCLAYAVENRIVEGIFGGVSARARVKGTAA